MASPDPNEATIPQARSLRYFFRRQWIHWTLAVLLAAAAYLLAGAELGNVGPDGRGDAWLGIGETTWFWIAVAVPILHQLLVWWVFRGQLGWGILTRWFGARDLTVWRVVFMPLLLASSKGEGDTCIYTGPICSSNPLLGLFTELPRAKVRAHSACLEPIQATPASENGIYVS